MRKSFGGLAFVVLVFSLVCMLVCTGCAKNGKLMGDVDESVYKVGTSLDQTSAYVDSAKSLTEKAKPESNTTGKALLSVATDQQQKALDKIKEGKTQVANAQAASAAAEKKFDATDAELTKVKHGWGYRTQVFVNFAFWILVSLFAFHFIGGIVATFIPGPIGAGLSVAAMVVNPGAWFQSAKDNYFFRKVKPKQEAAASAPAQPA